ncbi:hypothetical protein PsorP6_009532 [Peronosclerospora sorghi]|uniref:Uncharacterized protein n=1 Tax=Peronosclerospora sorghi TaxID=230839 RepID=A0ACC0W167_9STRA|nr:hypothetical protein PsorP6_009532 [Peronosclerospora sorghi]
MAKQQQQRREEARGEDNVALPQQSETIHLQHHQQQTAGLLPSVLGAGRVGKDDDDEDGEGQQQNGEEEGGTNVKPRNSSGANLKQLKRSYSQGAFTDKTSPIWR